MVDWTWSVLANQERNRMGKHKTAAINNRANQLNPCHKAYYCARGVPLPEAENLAKRAKPVLDNRSEQLNPKSSRLD